MRGSRRRGPGESQDHNGYKWSTHNLVYFECARILKFKNRAVRLSTDGVVVIEGSVLNPSEVRKRTNMAAGNAGKEAESSCLTTCCVNHYETDAETDNM